MVTTASQNVSYAMCRPGHMRLPQPKAPPTLGSRMVGSSCTVPSGLVVRKRSGLNCSGFGYASGSCRTDLRCSVSQRSQRRAMSVPVVHDHYGACGDVVPFVLIVLHQLVREIYGAGLAFDSRKKNTHALSITTGHHRRDSLIAACTYGRWS